VSTPPWQNKTPLGKIWQKISGSLQRLLIWVLILATWEAAYRIHRWKDYVFPYPTMIADALLNLLNIPTDFSAPLHRGWPMSSHAEHGRSHSIIHSELIEANEVSLSRLLVGFGISILLGGSLGLLMWRFSPLDQFLGPLFLGMQTLPSVCWQPLAILAFGLEDQAILFVLVMGSFFAVAISLRDGLRTIPPLYQRAGLMLGAAGWRLYAYVLLPASLPALCSGLRQGFSFGWRSLMGAEFVFQFTKRHGLGYLLEDARTGSNASAEVMGIMIVMVVIGMLADRLIFGQLEKRISHRFGLSGAK
jgi:NitT/TauT family transport system permease protein